MPRARRHPKVTEPHRSSSPTPAGSRLSDVLTQAEADFAGDQLVGEASHADHSMDKFLAAAAEEYLKDNFKYNIVESKYPEYDDRVKDEINNLINRTSGLLGVPNAARAKFRAAVLRAAEEATSPSSSMRGQEKPPAPSEKRPRPALPDGHTLLARG